MKFLTFTLAGPLASFGETERWDHRGTREMPTKSAVIGILGCCLGIPRGDEALRMLDEKIHMAVRRDRRGMIMTDFHTVQNPGGSILNTQRKPRGDTIITPRQYIQDALFQVFLFGDGAVLEQCARAMTSPNWVVSLGRRSNPPSIPMLPRIIEADSVMDALSHWEDPRLLRLGVRRDQRSYCQVEDVGGLSIGDQSEVFRTSRHDRSIRTNENLYGDRPVIDLYIERGESPCT